ncbi:hypothetical protein ACFJIW_22115 [Tahibacter sp. UC22_41]|uniref:hypothetical protein n=1 Tax=Tahibacter sp. UC22_41 TaxID=3350178 RepID=UPI0036D89718
MLRKQHEAEAGLGIAAIGGHAQPARRLADPGRAVLAAGLVEAVALQALFGPVEASTLLCFRPRFVVGRCADQFLYRLELDGEPAADLQVVGETACRGDVAAVRARGQRGVVLGDGRIARWQRRGRRCFPRRDRERRCLQFGAWCGHCRHCRRG